MTYPKKVLNFVDNKEVPSVSGKFFAKINPANGKILGRVARSNKKDASLAIESATRTFDRWSQKNIVERSIVLRDATLLMHERKKEIAEIVHLETGKSMKDAQGEVAGAIEL